MPAEEKTVSDLYDDLFDTMVAAGANYLDRLSRETVISVRDFSEMVKEDDDDLLEFTFFTALGSSS